MKKQNNQSIKAHFVRSALYVLLLVAACTIPFALAQRNAIKNTAAIKPDVPKSQFLPYDRSPVSLSRPAGICQYAVAEIGGSIVPGDTDTSNHCDDCITAIALPFSYTLYDQSFNSVNLSSNGNAQFMTTDPTFSNICLPWTGHNYTVFPYWDDLRTDMGAGCSAYPGGTCGIYTSVTGTAPNRIFNIEWRAVYFANDALQANIELRLYEGQTRFDVVYGTVANGNTSATAVVQRDDTTFTQYFCNGTGGAAAGGQSYTCA